MSAWESANTDIFGEGRIGEILLQSGGTLQIAPTDRVVANELGFIIFHTADMYDSKTLVAWSNLAWVRTRRPSSMKSRGLPPGATIADQEARDRELLELKGEDDADS